jgi:glycosyltransferase involved in cell wall biosynthesis
LGNDKRKIFEGLGTVLDNGPQISPGDPPSAPPMLSPRELAQIPNTPMRWMVLTPFTRSTGVGWIPDHIESSTYSFEGIPATYDHDRSRQRSGLREWLDYFYQSLTAWTANYRGGSERIGFLTSFPQLPVCLGILKRVTFSKAPIVAWCFNLGKTYGGMKGRLARFALSAVDIFVVHSTAEIEIYSHWLSIPRERFVFVPLSIQTNSFEVEDEGPEPFVVAIGTANRDYDCLIRALKPLCYKTIIVAGRHAAENLALPPFIEVRSGLSLAECHKLSQRARVNVIPIKNVDSASGQVTLLETMMFGKAVVATRCAGTVDYVTDKSNALLVEPDDDKALSLAISQLWCDENKRKMMGDAARSTIFSSVTFEAVAPQMLEVLDRLSTVSSVN